MIKEIDEEFIIFLITARCCLFCNPQQKKSAYGFSVGVVFSLDFFSRFVMDASDLFLYVIIYSNRIILKAIKRLQFSYIERTLEPAASAFLFPAPIIGPDSDVLRPGCYSPLFSLNALLYTLSSALNHIAKCTL